MTAITKKMTELNRLNQKLVWNETKEKDLFFPVSEEENFVQGTPTGKKTLYRMDRDRIEIISTVGLGYSVIPNLKIHNAVQSFTNRLKLNRKLSSIQKNKKTKLVYDIKSKNGNNIDIDKNNDGGHHIKLFVNNSYDGTTKISFELGIFRLVCSNGMVVPIGETYKMTKKHIGISQEPGKFEKNVHNFLMKTLKKENFQKILQKIDSMQKTKPTINFSLLKSLPINQVLPILEGIKKYATVAITITHYNKEYDLSKKMDNEKIKNLILEKKESERAKKRIKTEEKKLKRLEYNEKIVSLWSLLQFVIKIVCFKVNQNRRFDVIKKITSMM